GKHKDNIKVTFVNHHSCHYEKSKCKKKYLQEEEECRELEESHYWNEANCKCECYVQHVLNDCVLDRIVNHYQHTSAVYYVPMLAFLVGLVVAIILMYLCQQNRNKLQEKYNALNQIRTVSVHCTKHHSRAENQPDMKDGCGGGGGGKESKKTCVGSDSNSPPASVEDPGDIGGGQESPNSLALRNLCSDNVQQQQHKSASEHLEPTSPRSLRRTSGDSAQCPGGTHFSPTPVYLHTHPMHTQQLGQGYERVSYGWGS
ncbi:unnamed protein product, partial [Meganyctiphanes norvegica]